MTTKAELTVGWLWSEDKHAEPDARRHKVNYWCCSK